MRRLSVIGVLAVCLTATAALADPPAGFDARVARIAGQIGVPGVSVAIVEHGQVTLARGYGVRQLGRSSPVDSDTIFQIGSVSKAFTAVALARLVDSGRINWDDKVIDHVPYFQMYDPWVTREMTVADLLVHNSGLGLGAGDLMVIPRSTRSRQDVVRAIRHIQPSASFRSAYAYDNVLYIVAGQLIEEVSGKSWETFVREEVLAPAGMRTATSERSARRQNENRAWPHGRRDGAMFGIGTQEMLDDTGRAEFDPDITGLGAPAGGIAASANDMARWIAIQLAHGKLPEGPDRLFTEASSRAMWTPRIHVPIAAYPDPVSGATPQFNSYAMGWMERDYRGHRLLMHPGAVFGAQAILVLIPERDIGFAIMINSEDGEAAYGLAYELLDHYLGLPYFDWGAAWQQFVSERDQKALALLETRAVDDTAGPGPSRPLETYAGVFHDPWYGAVEIGHADGKLTMNFTLTPGMTGELQPWRHDTFRVTWRDRVIEPAYATFSFNADGAVDRISMQPVSPLADFSFDYRDLDLRPSSALAGDH